MPPDRRQRDEIYASPLQATVEQLRGLPPTLLQVAGNDVLRDEGLAFGRKLDSAGVDVTLVRYENLIHDYGLLNAISQVPAVRDALHQTDEMLKKYPELRRASLISPLRKSAQVKIKMNLLAGKVSHGHRRFEGNRGRHRDSILRRRRLCGRKLPVK